MSGKATSRSNRAVATFSFTAAATSLVPSICVFSAAPPNVDIQKKDRSDGTSTTPTTNSRIVRPFETRAMNMPTNGAHEIHHPQ